jgi:hypothetical protein
MTLVKAHFLFWHGAAWQARRGLARLGNARQGVASQVRQGGAWSGGATPGVAGYAGQGGATHRRLTTDRPAFINVGRFLAHHVTFCTKATVPARR